MRFLPAFARRSAERDAAGKLYAAVVARAREPVFYREGGVADTVYGRFGMICVHAGLLLRRLKDEGAAGRTLGQAVFDHMFADMDRSLRELGVGDLSVGRRVKRLAQHFYGCIGAYEVGLDLGAGALADALARNLYGAGREPPAAGVLAAMAAYVHREAGTLAGRDFAALSGGALAWGALPDFAAARGGRRAGRGRRS